MKDDSCSSKTRRKTLRRLLRSMVKESNEKVLESIYAEETIDFILDLLSDEEIDEESKIESIEGFFELNLNPETDPSNQSLSDWIKESVKSLMRSIEEINSTEDKNDEPDSDSDEAVAETLTNEDQPGQPQDRLRTTIDLDRRTKESIIKNYGFVPDDDQIQPQHHQQQQQQGRNPSDQNSLGTGQDEEVSRELLDQQLKMLDLKKKQRKKLESRMNNDPLLMPNLNSALVDHQNRLKKEQLSSKAKAKADKDKADLIKQRENQLKKKMDARAKATKLERKA
ncbi:hypothetical protein BY996DRAFT_6415438 [Phakopsora pachyrhizi]|uniref:Uncharacterized protein n=1 Tax=Phakopsora pachyrhizi TaxID=170000 RepID=A0AAV0BN57_PHAPC|nr:hypothetical protein BY996DRAFT_6415438 [Phakopsora pachyrhizi]CAH7688735.1 hypothetical protein PPACK8108_LOCUS23738 [Phakopsora pachyrhizi]